MVLIGLIGSITGSDNGAESITVDTIDENGFKNLVEQREGKILCLNVWATWCVPCREEFPDLVKIANHFQNKDVELIGISADFPDEIHSKIIPFLRQHQTNFPVYVKNFESDEAFINSVNSEWSGALPATVIYDRQGNQKMFHLGKIDFDTLRREIESVLLE